MPLSGRSILPKAGTLILAGVIIVVGIVWLHSSTAKPFPFSAFAAGLVALTLCHLVLVKYSRQLTTPELIIIACAALFFRVCGILSDVIFEDDFARYLWDGFQTALKGTPYGTAPAAAFADSLLSADLQRVLSLVNNPDYPTIYGALPEYFFALNHYLFGPNSHTLRVLYLLAEIVFCIWFFRRSRSEQGFALQIATHPLLMQAAYFSAHFEVLTVIALVFGAQNFTRAFYASAARGIALSLRLPLVLVTPFLFAPPAPFRPFSPRVVLRIAAYVFLSLLCVAMVALPLYYAFFKRYGTSTSDLYIIFRFAADFQFNSFLFTILEFLPALREKRLLLLLPLVAMLLYVWRQFASARLSHNEAISAALMALFLTSPVVNPWYTLWLLPFLRENRLWSARALPLLAMLSYVNGSHVMSDTLQLYQVHPIAWAIEYGVLLLFIARDFVTVGNSAPPVTFST